VSVKPRRVPGIPGSELPGPFPVGEYASRLRARLRDFARVQVVGEVVNLRPPTRTRIYFELRDAHGALPCAMWRSDWERLELPEDVLRDGAQVVVAGGCDYYPGSATSSPAFSFQVTDLRIAGEGDLLVRIERLRRALAAEGLFEPQKRLARPPLPRTIGVITGESGKARGDVLAGLRRRGWAGRVVWAFRPVQDRRAAPAITRALVDLAALPQLDVIVVARGGGSLIDLMAFCDETLCRTVALLRVPVIASVGHHTDRTLIDDVAAVSCSTPTHAAEAAVPLHCHEARAALGHQTRRLAGHARRAVLERARALAGLARAPARHIQRQLQALHQQLRELRASARRGLGERRSLSARQLLVLGRKGQLAVLERARAHDGLVLAAGELRRAGAGAAGARTRDLQRLAMALEAHAPERTLARGYALVEDRAGDPLTSAAAARRARNVRLRFADDTVEAIVGGRPCGTPEADHRREGERA
jgi:exodeoxyribonuclease VII large subunit